MRDSIKILFSECWQPQPCMELDTHYPGNDMKIIENVECAAKCQSECQKIEACDHWTWNENEKKCWLKDKKSYKSTQKGVHTGPKFCGKLHTCQLSVNSYLKLIYQSKQYQEY